MAVLITGAAGLVGTWLRRTAPAATEVVSVVHRHAVPGRTATADLRDRKAVERALTEVRPQLVVHAAVARDEASIVDATGHLVESTAARGVDLIFVSSEAVFSGDGVPRSETAVPDPIWDYGVWKAAAEDLVTTIDPQAAIVRLPLVVSSDPADHILRDIRAAGATGTASTWFTDEIRQPARADELTRAIWAIADLPSDRSSGMWHLPGPERLSRFEVAQRAVAAEELDEAWIVGKPTPPDARRPRDLHLTGERAERELGWSPSPIHNRDA